MMTWLRFGLVGLVLAAGSAQAADKLTGKEYKVLLDPTKFQAQPVATANTFLGELRTKLAAAGFDRTVDGSFAVDKVRTVRYYDSPGTCRLNNLGYNFRERVEGTKREINLKFRSDSQSTAANTNVGGSSSDAETKLEADITPPFKFVYSHSTTEPLSATKNLNILDDVVDLFPPTKSLNLPKQETLAIVGNLSINERTYDGPQSDLGQQDAEFTLTLWYAGSSSTVANAEVSFKVEDKDGDFTDKVDQRSKLIFDTIRGMSSWVSTNPTTKTQWVYQYQPNFCN
jgi:hypothetical protein